jgi:acetate---CoA ligase (ADP-forming)
MSNIDFSRVERLLRPRHVAIIGASGDPTKLTGRPIGYLKKYGFSGQIFPVNPRLSEIGDLTCYPDIQSLPTAPDVGLVLLGSDRAEQAVRDLAARGTAAAIVLASGYGEAGADGQKRQQALREAAGSMRILGPNTIGLVNLSDRIMLSASGALEVAGLPTGGISVVSQSGGILGSLLSRAADRGIGFAKLVSTGNEADLDTCDMLEYLVEDAETSVLAVYMEGLRRPDAFRRAARRAAEIGKPIVVFKVGRSESGARSAVSHTGALAGADRMYDALFKQLGIIRAMTFSDLLDIPAALASGRRARGNRVAILTSTGGAGTLIADSCGLAGLDVPALDTKTALSLAKLQGSDDAASIGNPVDVTLAGLRPDLFNAAMSSLLASPSFDATVVVVGSSALAQPHLVTDAAVACQSESDKPLIAYVSPHAPEIVRLLNGRGIPALTNPESCATVLAALMRPPGPAEMPAGARPAAVTGFADVTGALDEAESKRLFAAFGIRGVREAAATNPAEAAKAARELGGTVVVKILSRHIAHKSDVGGVKIGVAPENVAQVCDDMQKTVTRHGREAEGFLVQEMVSGGMEMILGLHQDPQLGAAILLGMGGVAAELFDDTAIRLLPISRQDAEDMVAELKTAKLLRGYRGAPPRDVEALIDAIVAFSAMGEQLGDRLKEAEVNPLFVMPAGQGIYAADGLAIFRDGP